MSFEDFDLDPRCLSVLKAQKIVEPTAIQDEAIPPVLEGRDVVGIAQTGTGKTLAFTLPSLTRLAGGPLKKSMMLVLTPTRELAQQVHQIVDLIGRPLGIGSVCIYGGVGFDKQIKALRQGRAVIVATPGRLLDHMGRGNVKFNDLETLVLDEADRMLDMGFLPDIRRILRKLPRERQTLMFSATFPDEIVRLTQDMLDEPVRISVGAIAKPVDTVRQKLYTVHRVEKTGLLIKILKEEHIDSALIFLRTKIRTDRVAKALKHAGFKAQAIHGDRSQIQRQRALDGFRSGRYKMLIATDVAARGLDIEGISHVFNYDIPDNPDDYIHRIGRTARANAEGDAITFVCPDEMLALAALEKALGHNLPQEEWEGKVPVLTLFHPENKETARSRRVSRRRGRSLLRRR
ncbi:MAG: DEAD/DEAH box helicase [Nitrospiraceae bacterium]|nr:DEAD/DEAH box helicase [Nitrospiraceae bacterium]